MFSPVLSHLIEVRELKYEQNLAIFLGVSESLSLLSISHPLQLSITQSVNIYSAPTVFQELFLVLVGE